MPFLILMLILGYSSNLLLFSAIETHIDQWVDRLVASIEDKDSVSTSSTKMYLAGSLIEQDGDDIRSESAEQSDTIPTESDSSDEETKAVDMEDMMGKTNIRVV
jgi:hypothetical protein